LGGVPGQPNQSFEIELRKLAVKFNTELLPERCLRNMCFLDPNVVSDGDPHSPALHTCRKFV